MHFAVHSASYLPKHKKTARDPEALYAYLEELSAVWVQVTKQTLRRGRVTNHLLQSMYPVESLVFGRMQLPATCTSW